MVFFEIKLENSHAHAHIIPWATFRDHIGPDGGLFSTWPKTKAFVFRVAQDDEP
jgi:hypothetical protein